jgi:hypothetical protein
MPMPLQQTAGGVFTGAENTAVADTASQGSSETFQRRHLRGILFPGDVAMVATKVFAELSGSFAKLSVSFPGLSRC